MIKVLVKCPPRGDFKGFFAAKQHWPEGITEREVTEEHAAALRTADVITLIAAGDEAISAYHRAQNPRPIEVKVAKPMPGEPGSPAKALKSEQTVITLPVPVAVFEDAELLRMEAEQKAAAEKAKLEAEEKAAVEKAAELAKQQQGKRK